MGVAIEQHKIHKKSCRYFYDGSNGCSVAVDVFFEFSYTAQQYLGNIILREHLVF